MNTEERRSQLREKTGTISTTNPIDVFIYILLKDYLPSEKVEEIFFKVANSSQGTVVFNNGWLGKYAIDLREQLEKINKISSNKHLEKSISEKKDMLNELDDLFENIQTNFDDDNIKRIKNDIEEFKKVCEDVEIEIDNGDK